MRLLLPYLELLSVRGGWRFSLAAWFGRLVRSTAGIGAILLVAGGGGDFATGGLAAGAVVLGAAIAAPLWSRVADRFGQTRALSLALPASALSATLLLVAVGVGLPVGVWIVAAFLVGTSSIDSGALARARWIHLLDAPARRHTALALEAAGDEFTFVIGPPIVTLVAGAASPAAGFAVGVVLSLVGNGALLLQRSTVPQVRPAAAPGARLRSILPLGVAAILPIHVGVGLLFGSVDLTAVGIATAAGASGIAGLLLAVFALGSVTSGLLWGAIATRWGVTRRLAVAGILFGVVTPLFLLVRDPLGFAVASFAAGLVMTPVLISASTLIESIVDRAVITTAMSWPSVGLSIGVTVGAALTGAALDGSGTFAGLAVIAGSAAIVLVGAVLNVAIRGRRNTAESERRAPHSPDTHPQP